MEPMTSPVRRLARANTALAAAVGIVVGALGMNLVNHDDPGGSASAAGAAAQVETAASSATSPAMTEPVGGPVATTPAPAYGSSSPSASGSTGAPSGPASSAPTGPSQATSAAAGGGPTGNSGSSARGVTATSIKLGYIHPDVGAFGVVPQFQVGDGGKILKSILDGWQRSGRDVVYGRKITAAWTTDNITDASSQRAACTKMVDDEKVFGVAAGYQIGVGSDCITKEKHTPLVVFEYAATDEQLLRDDYPYYFSGSPTVERMMRNWPHWMVSRNLIQGKKLGLYYPTTMAGQIGALKNELKAVQGNVVAEVTTDSQVTGPEDSIAVQQFRAKGVDVAVMLVNAVAQANFMRQANSQAYKPTYMEFDLSSSTDDTSASVYPPETVDGMYAMTHIYMGHTPTFAPETKACVDNYVKTWGAPPDQAWKSPWVKLNTACSAMELFHRGLELAGPNLTVQTFIHAMEQIRNMNVAYGQGVTFTPADHSGLHAQRTIQWQKGCGCYQKITDFAPLFVS
ncbi:MAG: ABC transporter substrate-binding protein [Acidobacteria bacterium]|nr:ABC transporter substrate-binding protein [Acidobacteriota bacterium]